MNRVTLHSNDNAAGGVLYMVMELSDKRWKLVFSDAGEKRRHETIEAGRRLALVEVIRKAKAKFHLSPEFCPTDCVSNKNECRIEAAALLDQFHCPQAHPVEGRAIPVFGRSVVGTARTTSLADQSCSFGLSRHLHRGRFLAADDSRRPSFV